MHLPIYTVFILVPHAEYFFNVRYPVIYEILYIVPTYRGSILFQNHSAIIIIPLLLQAFCSHSGFEEPRGTSTVRNEPGVLDITTCSVIP
jgi:hypothetical protein